jgi:beta-lactamase regulating signal transducer with metallopeptidase domain
MAVLWRAGRPLPVREVAAELNAGRDTALAYTTVMTVMSRLAGKGILTRSRSGRRFVYAPILVSTGLATALTPAEIGAVLAHEREHLCRRDPLRMLAARLAAAWGCYLPAGRWLASRAALRYELTADRAAAGRAGRSVLAGALLKLASMPACPAAAAASPAGDGPRSLEARVAQLEAGRPPRQRPAASQMLASAGTLSLLVPASMCCLAMSQFLPGGLL